MIKAPKRSRLGVSATIADLPVGKAGQDSPLEALIEVAKPPVRNKAKLRVAKPQNPSKKVRALKKGKARKQVSGALSAAPTASVAVYEDRLARLATAVQAVRAGQRISPRTTRLLAAGIPKMAQKLVEEAAETAIEAVLEQRTAFVNESADPPRRH